MTKNIHDYTFHFATKISEKHIDQFVSDFHEKYSSKKYNRYVLDFAQVEWISNQELLVITGLLKYLVACNIQFYVRFLTLEGTANVSRRKAKQFSDIWDVWKIYNVIPHQDYQYYFDIDGNTIARLRAKFNLSTSTNEIYDRYGVTPFISLEKVANYDDRRVSAMLDSIYRLNSATNEILRANNCYVPFENKTLSLIITKELYENFLDHFQKGFFNSSEDFAFMSLSLKSKFREANASNDKIQSYLKDNFEEEMFPEQGGFHKVPRGQFKNQSVLQLSFLDFGVGIPQTLKTQFLFDKVHVVPKNLEGKNLDSKILEYAFRPNSSQHPISKKYIEKQSIPRGLFDLLSIVKRFEGLLLARSNHGKILFDFSNGKSFEEAVSGFGDEELFFPGMLISIYFPERILSQQIEASTIKPYTDLSGLSFKDKAIKYISVFEIQQQFIAKEDPKETGYDGLFEILVKKIQTSKTGTLIYLDFKGYEIDERISKKIIFFLISDYSVNLGNNVIVINPPPIEFLDSIDREIRHLTEVDQKYKIHPTPFISLNDDDNSLSIFWLGVFSKTDIRKLNDLLFSEHDLRKSDFEEPEDVIGHINHYDKFGNLISVIDRDEIYQVYKDRVTLAEQDILQRLISDAKREIKNSIFLCSGNYYQRIYLQLFDKLSNKNDCEYIANALYDRLAETIRKVENIKFLTITASSQKIIKQLILDGKVQASQTVQLSNYHSYTQEDGFKNLIKEGDNVVLLCDVISTGYLIKTLEENLKSKNARLFHIGVIVNAIDKDFEPNKNNYQGLGKLITALISYPIKKSRRDAIKQSLIDRTLNVVRINPYTNTPIELSIKESNTQGAILMSNEAFANLIPDKSIKTGYFNFNNLIHPYFFDLKETFKDNLLGRQLLRGIFSKIDSELINGLDIIFYPKDSAIAFADFNFLKTDILRNDRIQVQELERFQTNEGWRFSHVPKFVEESSVDKKVLILDDGSCTGESVVQMIDEIAFLDVKEIVVLSIIGRTSDHKREFFSRLKIITGKSKAVKLTTVFGCHWHIPTYYIEESPVINETEWLNDIVNLANTPQRIRNIAKSILQELSLKDINGANNRQLLKKRDGDNIIKELILKKEEIGKMASYRFYKEYFDFFDDFISTYEDRTSSKDRYQKIELICAVFLHEPYLYEKITNVLPDLTEKMEEFVKAILFGNPNVKSRPKLPKSNLTYDWSNKDLFHIFFIVFQKKQLFEILTVANLVTLINEFCDSPSDVNYIFLKLLKYLSIKNEELQSTSFGDQIKHLIEATLEQPGMKYKSQLKIFRSFVSTLPHSASNFTSLLIKIKENYSKISDDDYHNEYIFNDKQIINTQLKIVNKKIIKGEDFRNEALTIQDAWANISSFIEDLLKFSIQYPDFFIPYKEETYDNLEKIAISLRRIHANLSDEIYSSNYPDIDETSDQLEKLFNKFIMPGSEYAEIFQSITSPNLAGEFDGFLEQLKGQYNTIKVIYEPKIPDSTVLSFPLAYLKKIIFKELKENLRHADLNQPITFGWKISDGMIVFTISNSTIDSSQKKGGGKGLARMNKLNDFPIPVHFLTQKIHKLYVQQISFTLI